MTTTAAASASVTPITAAFPLAARGVEQGFKELSHGRVHYRVEGEGPWLVLTHGYGANLHMWAQQRAALGEHFRLLSWDVPGFGASDGLTGAFTMADFAQAQAELMDALGIGKAHICGLSMGGMVTMAFAERFPRRVRSLLLCDTVATRIPAAGRFIFSLYHLRGRLGFDNFDWKSRLEHLDRHEDKTRWGVSAEERNAHLITLSLHDQGNAAAVAARTVMAKPCHNDVLAGMDVPVLVVVGTEDVLYKYALDMHALQPQSRLVVMEGVNHGSAVIHPHAFNRTALDFLFQAEEGKRPTGTFFLPQGFPVGELEPRHLDDLAKLWKDPTLLEAVPHVWNRLMWALFK